MTAGIGHTIGPTYSVGTESTASVEPTSAPKIIEGMTAIRAPNGELISVDLTNVYPYERKLDYTEKSDPDVNEYVVDYQTTGSKSRLIKDTSHINEFDDRDIVIPPGSVFNLTSNENYRACQEISYATVGFVRQDWLGAPAFYRIGHDFHPTYYKTIHIWVDPRDTDVINWINQQNIDYRNRRAEYDAEIARRASMTAWQKFKEDCVIQ